jgi:hypothetical protein
MSSRLRSLDSKISFFAFADIITAVSGVLIFVALLLATDLGVPTDSHSPSTNPELDQQLQEVLAQQVVVDAQNQSLEPLLTAAATAPDATKLQADIKCLKAQMVEEQRKQAALSEQMSESKDAIAKRDAELGLTSLKSQIQREIEESKEIAAQDANVKTDIDSLDQHIAGIQSQLLQLRKREGKLWLIPEKGATTKKPVLAIVAGNGIRLEQFDHPELAKEFASSTARSDFESYLKQIKPADEYVVFLVRPSGIALFQDLVSMVRDDGVDVGFDAIEEDKEVYFTTPPVLDETVPAVPNVPSGFWSGSGGYSGSAGGTGNTAGTGAGFESGPHGSQGSGAQSGSTSGVGTASGSGFGNYSDASGVGGAPGNNTGRGSGNNYQGGTGKPGGFGGKSDGTEAGNGTGNGAPKSATTGNINGQDASTNTQTGASKKGEPKKTTNPVTNPQPVEKSWWQRFKEWVLSFLS